MDALRTKLFRPDNAVPDTGFHFKNGKPVKGLAEPVQCVRELPVGVEPLSPRQRSLWGRRKTDRRWKRKADPAYFIPPGFRWSTLLQGFEPRIPKPERHLTTRHILMAVAKVWDIQPRFLTGPQRETFIINPRQAVMALARMLTDASKQEIGKVIQRDASTVLHASRKLAPHIHATALKLGDSRCPLAWARAMKARLEA